MSLLNIPPLFPHIDQVFYTLTDRTLHPIEQDALCSAVKNHLSISKIFIGSDKTRGSYIQFKRNLAQYRFCHLNQCPGLTVLYNPLSSAFYLDDEYFEDPFEPTLNCTNFLKRPYTKETQTDTTNLLIANIQNSICLFKNTLNEFSQETTPQLKFGKIEFAYDIPIPIQIANRPDFLDHFVSVFSPVASIKKTVSFHRYYQITLEVSKNETIKIYKKAFRSTHMLLRVEVVLQEERINSVLHAEMFSEDDPPNFQLFYDIVHEKYGVLVESALSTFDEFTETMTLYQFLSIVSALKYDNPASNLIFDDFLSSLFLQGHAVRWSRINQKYIKKGLKLQFIQKANRGRYTLTAPFRGFIRFMTDSRLNP